jgi:hypothetical protein
MPQTLCHNPQNEAELVKAITDELTARGWTILRIGQHVAKGSGTTTGTPDLACYHPCIKPFCRLVEVKFGTNKPTPAQQALIEAGASIAVWSVDEALAALGER